MVQALIDVLHGQHGEVSSGALDLACECMRRLVRVTCKDDDGGDGDEVRGLLMHLFIHSFSDNPRGSRQNGSRTGIAAFVLAD